MRIRSPKQQHPAPRGDIGDLVTRVPLPRPSPVFDPFLMLAHHGPQVYPPHNGGLPFGPHPHRGFETVTFVLDGELAHRDSSGHESVIGAGGVQWMTAGRGIVHAEQSPASFRERGGPLEILQLWVNLPARLKATPPRYVGLARGDIPLVELDHGRVRVQAVAGDWFGTRGPVDTLIDLRLGLIAFEGGGHLHIPVAADRTVLLYILRGDVVIAGAEALPQHLVELDGDGDEVEIEASSDSLVLFGDAPPLREPVVASGPFVMNTEDEIDVAIADYQRGALGRLDG